MSREFKFRAFGFGRMDYEPETNHRSPYQPPNPSRTARGAEGEDRVERNST